MQHPIANIIAQIISGKVLIQLIILKKIKLIDYLSNLNNITDKVTKFQKLLKISSRNVFTRLPRHDLRCKSRKKAL